MNKPRLSIAALCLSAAGLVGIVYQEGYVETAMVPTKNDRPTVGFGSTFRDDGTPVRMGDRIDPVRAIARSAAHIAKDETALKRCVTGDLSQVEYDVLVDFAYQYGVATTCQSSVVRNINTGNYRAACEGYLSFRYLTSGNPTTGWDPFRFDAAGKPIRWRFDCSTPGNRVCAGVWKRNLDRRDKCMAAQ
jgi:lysozyme